MSVSVPDPACNEMRLWEKTLKVKNKCLYHLLYGGVVAVLGLSINLDEQE